VGKHCIGPGGRPTASLLASFQKKCPPHGSVRVRTPPRGSVRVRTHLVLVGPIGSGVRVSASFQKKARLVGRLGSGPHLVADRADVVPTDRVD